MSENNRNIPAVSEKIINRPLAPTFGWLRMNGTKITLPDEISETSLRVEEGEKKIVILEGSPIPQAFKAEVANGALLQLIQVDRETAFAVTDIRVTCGEGARFEWYRVALGTEAGATTAPKSFYDNCSVTLEGKESSFDAQIAARLGGTDKLDINCEVIHLGKKTLSNIYASSVLSDESFKLLRGTIDLRKGCAGAKGSEFEEALLLSETVHNQSIPVILCSEEDVEGNHGATIGQIPEEIIYYMGTRGISRDAAYELLSRARIDAVIRRLPDEGLKRELLGEEEL